MVEPNMQMFPSISSTNLPKSHLIVKFGSGLLFLIIQHPYYDNKKVIGSIWAEFPLTYEEIFSEIGQILASKLQKPRILKAPTTFYPLGSSSH
jgi:hypothetical protein